MKPKRGSTRRSSRRHPPSPVEAPPASVRPLVVALTLGTFVLVYASLQWWSLTRTSATFDEPGNLAAGYAALAHGDYRPAIEHPPLTRLWAALPLATLPEVSFDARPMDALRPEAVAYTGPFEIGHRFLYKNNDADRLLYRARFMTVLLGAALGVLVFCWAGEWLGFRAAAIALGLYAVEPNLAAHSGLVTTDLGVTCFMFGAVYFLWRAFRHFSAPNIAALTACFVLAVLSKFSALILGPVILLLMVAAARRGRTFTVSKVVGITALLAAAAWVGVWAAYGFRYAPSDSPGWLFALHAQPAVQQAVPTLAAAMERVDALHLLPNAFTQGFLHGQGLVQGRPAFLAGSYSNFGWWSYFPVAFLLKTPLALLVLFAAGIFGCVRRGRLSNLDVEAFVVLPAAIFLAVAMTSALSIGLRHILPIYPFVLLLAAGGAQALLHTKTSRGPIALAVLLAAAALEFASVYPNNLAFFNRAVGGPREGYHYLADSNIDWGQDLKPLKRWMDGRGAKHVNLAYFGTADPAYYGIDCTYIWGTTIPGLAPSDMGPPRLPGYVAVSVTLLNGVPFDERQRDFYKPLRDRQPAADIGGSIKVYWVEKPWW